MAQAGGEDAIELQPPAPTAILGEHGLAVSTTNEAPVPLLSPDPAATASPAAKARVAATILAPSLVNFLASFVNGVITIGLPTFGPDLALSRALYLWPMSVYGLTSGSALLLAGSVADLVGPRRVELAGVFLTAVCVVAAGAAASGAQLVALRALQGVAVALHMPASVALVARAVPPGRARNVGFACLGLSQPLGFSVGLVLSGVLIEKVSWRAGFYISGGAMLLTAAAEVWLLPRVEVQEERAARGVLGVLKRVATEIDWIGGALASGGLAMLAYVLAVLSADLSGIRSTQAACLLGLGIVLLVAFPFWMRHRERSRQPALIPNSLWTNVPFTSTCIMVLLSYGAMNAMELFSSLYFQEIQNKSTLTTSLYLLPNLTMGVFINLGVGLLVDRLPARWLVTLSSLLCALAPFTMALVDPHWNYWLLEFWAQVFAPLSGDVLFTVGLIIVSDNFPQETQALAGAVFSTVGQFGQSLGIGVCQVVALGVAAGRADDAGDGDTLLQGYRASFWTMFAYMIVCGVIALFGLRKAGNVGLKRE